ncbi:MAG: hypothetical protein ACK5L6_13905 [Anaerorhabdus sp.]|uniref:hypothetical protein n=1 Tax=Anaerorhabdus sp. TaxID=1872524 RepID=UPI003A882B39
MKSNYIEIDASVENDGIEVDVNQEVVIMQGTENYNDLKNKPKANGVLLQGDVEVTTHITNSEMDTILKF